MFDSYDNFLPTVIDAARFNGQRPNKEIGRVEIRRNDKPATVNRMINSISMHRKQETHQLVSNTK